MMKPTSIKCLCAVIYCLAMTCLLTSTLAFGKTLKELGPDFEEVSCDGLELPVYSEGMGGMRYARCFVLKKQTWLHRAYDDEQARKEGRYWSFERSEGRRDEYRIEYGMCAERNKMTYTATCILPKGTVIVLGPGQSMNCKNDSGSYTIPASDHLHVYVVNPPRACKQLH